MQLSPTISPATEEQRARHASPLPLSHKLLILVYGASLLLIGLGVRTLTRHEVLAAYPAKEMLRGESWIVPMYAGIPRTAKPPLMHWIIAAFMTIFGSDKEWVVRLPSVIAAVALALMVATFAAHFFGPRIGLISGLIQLTSIYLLIQSRLAEADMLLVTLITAAVFIFASGPVTESESGGERRFKILSWRPIVFYALIGVTFLLKGLVGPAFVLIAALIYAAIQRDRGAFRFLANPVGIVIFLAFIIIWPLAAYLKYPAIWESWRFEQFGRLTGERGWTDPFYYFYQVPGSLLPWTPLIIVASWIGFRKKDYRRPLIKFFLCFFTIGVVVLSCIPFKHQQYAYPLFPPLSILAAIGLLQYIDHQHRHKRPMHGLAAAVLIFTCAALAIAAFYIPRAKIIASSVAILLGLLTAGGLAAIYMEHRRNLTGQLIAIFATAWVLPVLVQLLIIPTVDDYKSEANLARAANALVRDNSATIYIIDPALRVEPHCAYYLRPPIRRYRDVNDFLKNGPTGSIYLFTNVQQRDELAKHGRIETPLRREGFIKPLHEKEPIVISYTPSESPKTP